MNVFLAGLNHPFSLDVFESHLYWVSKVKGEVTMLDKFGRGVNQTLQAGLLMPHSIKIYQQYRFVCVYIFRSALWFTKFCVGLTLYNSLQLQSDCKEQMREPQVLAPVCADPWWREMPVSQRL